MSDHAATKRGHGLPACRDHYTLILQIAEHNARVRATLDLCESGCTSPVVVTVPAPLCEDCAREMGVVL